MTKSHCDRCLRKSALCVHVLPLFLCVLSQEQNSVPGMQIFIKRIDHATRSLWLFVMQMTLVTKYYSLPRV